MNMKYYELPIEKQQRIKYAGYKIFGENAYNKTSMKELADEAGISKALVFHYFKNKNNLYQWLFQEAIDELNVMRVVELPHKSDFFDLINEVIFNRLEMMGQYQVIYRFVMRVYEEASHDGHEVVFESIIKQSENRKNDVLKLIDLERFKVPTEVSTLYDLINDLANGYYQRIKRLDIEMTESTKSFFEYIDSLKRHYYKEEYL